MLAPQLGHGVDGGFLGCLAHHRAARLPLSIAPLGAVAVKELDVADRQLVAVLLKAAPNKLLRRVLAPVRMVAARLCILGRPSRLVQGIDGEVQAHGKFLQMSRGSCGPAALVARPHHLHRRKSSTARGGASRAFRTLPIHPACRVSSVSTRMSKSACVPTAIPRPRITNNAAKYSPAPRKKKNLPRSMPPMGEETSW